MSAVELLREDKEGAAIDGPKLPKGSVAVWLDDGMAYCHTFFCKDEHGQALPDTAVQFFVPDYLLVDGFPGQHALVLVAQRMGWADGR